MIRRCGLVLGLIPLVSLTVLGTVFAQEACKVTPATLFASNGLSQIVVAPDRQTVYISGQVAQDSAGAIVGEGDFKAQATQVFANLRSALAAVNATFADIVKWNFYLTSIANLPALREARIRALGTITPPASTLVEVASLSRRELQLEIEAVAIVATPIDCAALRARVQRRPRP